jgi:two-component system, cell cycle sensor histidine kinase and response regulator CckA
MSDRKAVSNSETLLLVEDNDEARDALRRALEWHGYTVLVARDAGEAEARFRKFAHVIDLMVADVVLPDRSGVVLAARLARSQPGLRVLFLSGYAGRELSLDADGIGPSGFLEKPVTIRQLGEEVRRLLDTATITTPPRARAEESPGSPSEHSPSPTARGWP